VDGRLHVTAKWKQSVLRDYLNDPRVSWRHKRREMMAIAGIIPVAKWLAKIKQRSDVSCRLCKRAREQGGASTENLPEETYGHINSAFCDGMATTVTAAHHFIWRHLYASIQTAQTPTSKLRFLLSSAAEERWRRGKAGVRWANQRRNTQKAQHKYQNGWICLILPRNYTKAKVIVESLWW